MSYMDLSYDLWVVAILLCVLLDCVGAFMYQYLCLYLYQCVFLYFILHKLIYNPVIVMTTVKQLSELICFLFCPSRILRQEK